LLGPAQEGRNNSYRVKMKRERPREGSREGYSETAVARLLRGLLHTRGAFLGAAGAYDSGGNQAVSMTVGALFGLLLGVVFGGVRGRWLDSIFGPEEGGEADEKAAG
jgi:hypothetical protein